MTSHQACISGTYRVLTLASLQRLNLEALIPAPADGEVRTVCDKVFECPEHNADRNSSHWTRIRRVQNSNPGADQSDWGSFRGFPQSSRQVLCWISILRSIYQLFINTLITNIKTVTIFKRTLDTRYDCHTVVAIPGVRLLRHRGTKVDPMI